MLHRSSHRLSRLFLRRFWIVFTLLVSNTSFLSAPHANAQVGLPTPPSANGDIGFLSGPTTGDPLTIALGYIRQHVTDLGLTSDDLRDIVVKDRYMTTHNGITHLYLRQRLNGIEVFNGDINVNVTRDGRIINIGNGFVADLAQQANSTTPAIDAPQALQQVATDLGLNPAGLAPTQPQRGPDRSTEVSARGVSADPVPMQLIYQPLADGTVRLAWNMVLRLPERNQWLDVRADAQNGQILSQVDWGNDHHSGSGNESAGIPFGQFTPGANAPSHGPVAASGQGSYNVFPLPADNPADGTRTVIANPADPEASPFGWHDIDGQAGAEYTTTGGNNTFTYADIALPDGFTSGDVTTEGGSSLTFDAPLDLSQLPNTYRDAAITQLFYTTNTLHDILYHYGFDEASGNFQHNTYGRGGIGNDAVNAEAQDYAGINNANFFTPPDGETPRMQMYLGRRIVPKTEVVSPASLAGPYNSRAANFGPSQFTVTADSVLIVDGVAPTADGCQAPTNAAALVNRIAVIDRGGCDFVVKVKNAQDAGAVAAIIVNNLPGAAPGMGGTDPTITIPTVSLSQSNGQLIKDALANGTVTFDLSAAYVDRDGSFDTGVVIHEYGHGLSTRLTGGPSNSGCMSNSENRGLGEGWSDFVALALTARATDTRMTQYPVGIWLNGDDSAGLGIRQYPYTTDMAINPHVFSDVLRGGSSSTPGEVHDVGEVWTSMLWEVYWNLTEQDGFDPDMVHGTGGNNLALQLVIDGMKLQPCNPTFVEARNAILQADLVNTNGANQCRIWEGFTKRGLGYSADAGDSTTVADSQEAFDLPPTCAVSVSPPEQQVCLSKVGNLPFTIGLGESLSGSISMSVADLPPSTTATFANTPLTAPNGTTLTINDISAAPPGTYSVKVIGTDSLAKTYTDTTTLYLADAVPGATTLQTPADGGTDIFEYDPFSWSAVPQAVGYSVELANDPTFTDLVFSETVRTTTYTYPIDLVELQRYYWRVTSFNGCGSGPVATGSFTVRDVPRILLVDDDNNDPDVVGVYTDLLDQLGVRYDLWDTGDMGESEPGSNIFTNYKTVIWIGGPSFYGALRSETETVLASFLDRGNCLVVSAQDYFAQRGLTPFMENYLGVAAAVDDTQHASVTGNGPFEGLGPYTFDFSSYFDTNYTDLFTPTPTAGVAFTGDKGTTGVYKDTGTYRTLFMGFPVEAVASQDDQLALMARAVNWCDFQTELSIEQTLITSSTMLPGQPLTYTLSFRNAGIAVAANTQLTVVLPTGLQEIHTTSSSVITPTGAAGVWQIGDLAPQASGIFTLTASIDKAVSADSDLEIEATIGSKQLDTNLINNRQEASIRIEVPQVSMAASEQNAREGDGQASASVVLNRSNPYADTTVAVAASGGTAQQGSDYTVSSTTVIIPAGSTSAQTRLTITDDSVVEQAETVELTLVSAQGAVIGTPKSTTVTITDDDTAAVPQTTYWVYLPLAIKQ